MLLASDTRSLKYLWGGGERARVNFVLEPTTEQLDELVVVGYGMVKKKSLTGAIADISSEDILTTKSPSLAVSLAGKIPGLMIRQTSGQPGMFETSISMRGQGTPMFVIDGVVRNDATEFQKLAPEDIESISVLKDGSAAIYGINSSNGVMVITTKKGGEGPLKVSYNGSVGLSSPARLMELLSSSQYWEMRNEKTVNTGGAPYFATREALEEAMAQPTVDWYDETFKKASFSQMHSLSVSGGNEKISAYANIGWQKDYGLLRSNDIGYSKFSFRTSTTYRPNKYWEIQANISGHKDNRYQPGTWGDSFFYINKAVHAIIPSETVFANNNEEYYNRPLPTNDNPVEFSQKEIAGYREWKEFLMQSSLSVTFSLPWVDGLKLRVLGSYDYKDIVDNAVQKRITNYTYSSSTDTYTPGYTYDASIQEQHNMDERYSFSAMAMYNKTIRKHSIDATVAFEMRQEPDRYLSAKRLYDGLFFTKDQIDLAPTNGQTTAGNTHDCRYMSVIGRFNYSYAEKYLVELAFREDGSYRYAPGQRWGFFPVASVGWRISEEPFVKNNAPWITNLKLRASYGVSGEDAGDAFQWIPGYKSDNGYVLSSGSFTTGYSSMGLVNENLTWVTSKIADIGIDLDFWNSKLTFTFDVYRKDREGLLATRAQALPNYFGATLPQENLNADRNEGFDFVIGHNNRVGEFYYGISFNMNMNRSMPTRVERADFQSSYDRWRNGTEGRWSDIGWAYDIIGQFQGYDDIRNSDAIYNVSNGNRKVLPGDYILNDANGDGVIDGSDKVPLQWIGEPKINFGLNLMFAWKGIDFNMQWHGAAAYTARFTGAIGPVLNNQDTNNGQAKYYDRWHLADVYDPDSEWVSGKYPAVRNEDYFNNDIKDALRISAAYARVKNIEVGYTFPGRLLEKSGITNLRIYLNALNPFMISGKEIIGFDPELKDGEGFQYPLTRTFNLGVNLSF